jgi:hypothetical protein
MARTISDCHCNIASLQASPIGSYRTFITLAYQNVMPGIPQCTASWSNFTLFKARPDPGYKQEDEEGGELQSIGTHNIVLLGVYAGGRIRARWHFEYEVLQPWKTSLSVIRHMYSFISFPLPCVFIREYPPGDSTLMNSTLKDRNEVRVSDVLHTGAEDADRRLKIYLPKVQCPTLTNAAHLHLWVDFNPFSVLYISSTIYCMEI